MKRATWTLTLVAALLLLQGSNLARADHLFPRPAVSYYYAPPAVSYYTPTVTYTPAYVTQYYTPAVSYYAAPSVTYYTPSVSYYTPSVSYYAAPVVAPRSAVSTTTTYGLFGRPKSTTTYYYQPIVVAP